MQVISKTIRKNSINLLPIVELLFDVEQTLKDWPVTFAEKDVKLQILIPNLLIFDI